MSLLTRRFTVDEYHRMAQAGILHEDDRLELLGGEIVTMSPAGSRHAGTVARLQRLCQQGVGDRAIVWVQNPIRLGPFSELQPDLCLLQPREDYYASRLPEGGDVLLTIEVADSSLVYDREQKLPVYAEAGIPEVWLVVLPAEAVELHREPRAGRYTTLRTAGRGETIRPLAFPDLALAAGGILG